MILDGFVEQDKLIDISRDCLDFIHKVIDVAGANHCSFLTSPQVINCLNKSSYWDKKLVYGYKRGCVGNNNVNYYTPSEKGKLYYEKYLKDKEVK